MFTVFSCSSDEPSIVSGDDSGEVDDPMTPAEPTEPTLPGTLISFTPDDFSDERFQTVLADVADGQYEMPITIDFAEGEYTTSTAFTFSGVDGLYIKGAGMDKTIIDFDFSVQNGFPIQDSENVILEDFTVKNTTKSIMEIRGITGLRLSRLGVYWDELTAKSGPYAIYPTESTNVIVENCYAKNAIDAGIYSGQNTTVLLENNESESSVFGLEVENSIDTVVRNNYLHDNSSGALIYDLAGLSVIKNGTNVQFTNNRLENNNRRNFAAEIDFGGFIGAAPYGVGIVLAATDNVEISNNVIIGQEVATIVGASYFLVDPEFDPSADPEFTVFAENIEIFDNQFDTFGDTAIYNDEYMSDNLGGELLRELYKAKATLLGFGAPLFGFGQPAGATNVIWDDQNYELLWGLLLNNGKAQTKPYVGDDVSVMEASFVPSGIPGVNWFTQVLITSRSLDTFSERNEGFTDFTLPTVEKVY